MRWLFGILLALILPQGALAASLDPTHCRLTALATDDNDFRLNRDPRPPGKPVELPKAVANLTVDLARRTLDGLSPDLSDGLGCKVLFPPAYRIRGASSAELFVMHIALPIGPDFFYLVLHNPKTGAVTRDPPRIGAKWPEILGATDSIVRPPYVFSSHILRGKAGQLVFEERVHNGTLYNGIIYHYFEAGPDLELKRVLAVETRVYDPSGQHIYLRELTQTGPNQIREDMYETPPNGSAPRKWLGYVVLENQGFGTAFHLKEKHSDQARYSDALLTFCDSAPSDEAFLRDGCDFYY